MQAIGAYYLWLGIIGVWLIPTFIAIGRDMPNKAPIILVNTLGSVVFGVGWLVALVMAAWSKPQPQRYAVR